VADQVTSKPVSHWFAWPETDQENCEAVWFLDAVLRHAVLWEPATCWISDTPPALESASRFSSGMGLLAGTDTEGIRHGYDVICSGIKLELDLPSVSHAYNGLASAHIVRSRAVQVGRFGYIVKERLVAHGPDRAHSEFRIDAYLCEVQVQRLTRSRPRTAASRCSTSMSRPVASHRRTGRLTTRPSLPTYLALGGGVRPLKVEVSLARVLGESGPQGDQPRYRHGPEKYGTRHLLQRKQEDVADEGKS
jgi:hypothetical protein